MPEAMEKRRELTARQTAILDFIRDAIRNGRPPTIREICQFLKVKSPNGVMGHLRALQHKGYIRRDPLKSRAIELVGETDKLRDVLERSRILALGKLRDSLEKYARARVVVRYGDHPLIRKLYSGRKWVWREVSGRTQTNADKAEVLILNGPSQAGANGTLF